MNTTELMQKVQFINGLFSPNEAKEVISKTFDNEINQCKLERLSKWIKNENCDQSQLDNKITELTQRKEELCRFFSGAKEGKIALCGDINISYEK